MKIITLSLLLLCTTKTSCQILGIKSTDITALNGRIIVQFETIREDDTKLFIVEKSYDAKRFDICKKIKPKGNNSFYQFVDSLQLFSCYYRVGRIDIAQDTTYTEKKFIQVINPKLVIYPNPSFGHVTVISRVNFEIFDVRKQRLDMRYFVDKAFFVSPFKEDVQTELKLPHGVYFLVVGYQVYKLIVL